MEINCNSKSIHIHLQERALVSPVHLTQFLYISPLLSLSGGVIAFSEALSAFHRPPPYRTYPVRLFRNQPNKILSVNTVLQLPIISNILPWIEYQEDITLILLPVGFSGLPEGCPVDYRSEAGCGTFSLWISVLAVLQGLWISVCLLKWFQKHYQL